MSRPDGGGMGGEGSPTRPEEWRPVPGWKHYEVSSHGRVRSKDRFVNSRWGARAIRGQLLKPRVDKLGHRSVGMTQDGVSAIRSVARLVAAAWLGFDMEDRKQIILHKNDNVQDNRPENLLFGTAYDLAAIRERHGTDVRGEDVGISRLSKEQVREILEACASGASARGLARKYGVSRPVIHNIRDRKTWTHVEYAHRPSDADAGGMVPEPSASASQSGTVPYGFQRSACRCYTEPNESERAAFRLMVEWSSDGVSLAEIARRLTRLGHTTRSGGPVNSRTVHGLLKRYPTEADSPWGDSVTSKA